MAVVEDQEIENYTKCYKSYFTEQEIQLLTEKQRGKLTQTQDERLRQQACGFLAALSRKMGFPKRTLGTAQNLYHRFHLYFHKKAWQFHDVAQAALYVSAKIHDTLKKPYDVLKVGYALRFPELAAKSKAVGSEIEMPPATVAQDTETILAIERLMLEVICFNFMVKVAFPYVIKMGRALKATKELTHYAWRVATDSNRTFVPLMYPPHVVALGCIYTAALLTSFDKPPEEMPSQEGHRTSHDLAQMLGQEGEWEAQFQATAEDLDEIAHSLIDLLHSFASTMMQVSSSPQTPQTPVSPHPHKANLRPGQASLPPPPPYKPEMLIRLKIAMRAKSLRPTKKRKRDKGDGEEFTKGSMEGFGKNIGTTKYNFSLLEAT